MAKRTQSSTRRSSGTTATTSAPNETTADLLEQRVLALAERLGRIVGTVQAKTAGWLEGDALKEELASVRDAAADLLQQLTGNEASAPVARKRPAAVAPRNTKGRSGGGVDAPGKKHRPPVRAEASASRANSQAATLRAAKTMAKTHRRRGRG
jgi:hypothetical protein